jgi:predicted transcriptional regulator
MGLIKSELFSVDQNELANLARGMAHPARIAILQHLLRANTCINSDLVEELGLAQATISQHLKELKSLGLIQGTVEGVRMCYCIHQENWKRAGAVFAAFFEALQDENMGCCE